MLRGVYLERSEGLSMTGTRDFHPYGVGRSRTDFADFASTFKSGFLATLGITGF
jgi:hypothetical protein